MERQAHLNTPLTRAVVIIHAMGVLGLAIPASRPVFVALVPWHLLAMFILMTYDHRGNPARFGYFAVIVFLLGYLAEYTGVHTALLFGNYSYGPVLGYRLACVPVIIGINWFLLVYAVGTVLAARQEKYLLAWILKGAVLLVLLDLLIEPVAQKLNYWQWQGNEVPFKNYACWFALGALFLLMFSRFRFAPQSRLALVFLVVQFVFFALLNLVI